MKLLAYAAIAAGGVGAYNRYQASSGSTSPTTGLAQYTGTFDPASFIGVKTTSSVFDAGMLIDLALVGLGVWMLMRY
jgi:hypothetical protein